VLRAVPGRGGERIVVDAAGVAQQHDEAPEQLVVFELVGVEPVVVLGQLLRQGLGLGQAVRFVPCHPSSCTRNAGPSRACEPSTTPTCLH
jgi:hypothetical protein